jgi:hypothetical protein
MNLIEEQEAMRRRMVLAKAGIGENEVETKKLVKAAKEIKLKKPKRHMNTYFIQGRMTEFIKIGKASDVKKRLLALRIGSPDELVLLAQIDGDQERKLHKRFSADRHHGEWFFPNNVLKFLKNKFHQFI